VKTTTITLILLVATAWLSPAGALAQRIDHDRLDARQAMELANRLGSNDGTLKSYVTPREVVFEFADGRVERVALPEDEMVVALAPYRTRTHE
jgi:hypothetical protein